MINLIPPTEKKRLKVEYWLRAVTVWMIVWSITLVMGMGVLLPTYVLISSQVSVYEEGIKGVEEDVSKYQEANQALNQANLYSKIILDEKDDPLLSSYISLFKSLKGNGININNISLSRDNEAIAPAIISGVAVDRESLAEFRDKLTAHDQILSADLPLSNLAQDKNITFAIKVEISNETNP